jgi:outer membrane protein OmpA-like peptidoglycan-associated protein
LGKPDRLGDQRGALGGDYWAIAAYLAVPALVLLLLATALPPDAPPAFPESRIVEVRELIHDRTLALQEWPRLLGELCREPQLLEVGLAPSCSEGAITLADAEFFDPELRGLTTEAKRRLRIAVPVLLDRLRASDHIWRHLAAIEVRGHADPRALRDPYATNLRASQRRALAVLLFLTGDERLPQQDRRDLQRLALSSGASHSRPPPDCRARSPECDSRAKRVEIRIGIDPDLLRAQLGDFHDEVMQALAP